MSVRVQSVASSLINASVLAMAEGKDFAHDSLYRALQQPLALYFTLALELCYQKGGRGRGYLILDDVLIPRYSPGHLKLQRFKDLSSGAYTYAFSLVVLAWTDGQTRLPLAFLPYFGGEEASRLYRIQKDNLPNQKTSEAIFLNPRALPLVGLVRRRTAAN